MNETLSYKQPVILLGGGDCDLSLLQRMTSRGWSLVAADGGANRLIDKGIEVSAIIGDLDSLQQRSIWETVCPVIHVQEQDSTDFEKCLYHCSAPLFVALGFTGMRFDHTLAALHVLHRYADSKNTVLVSDTDVITVIRGTLSIQLPVGCRFSVYPLERVAFSRSDGLRYPLDGLVMESGKQIGCSNCTSDTDVIIQPSDPTAYAVILPASAFDSLTQALDTRA